MNANPPPPCDDKTAEVEAVNSDWVAHCAQLTAQLTAAFPQAILETVFAYDELTLEVKPEWLQPLCHLLATDASYRYDLLLDICGVDYLTYGQSEWCGEAATATGFDRGVDRDVTEQSTTWKKPRFASVYHLLSTHYNRRLRLRVFVPESTMTIDSVTSVWPAANWYEREAFDLFGIIYEGHPDLRRLLTDYGFIGHPFRKDFPLSGHVEVRYDATRQQVIYEPVDIEPRVLVPKVVRYHPPQSTQPPQPPSQATQESDDG